MKVHAAQQCFPKVLFYMLQKVVLSFESVDEILNCLNFETKATDRDGLDFVTVYYEVLLTFKSVD